MQFVAASAFAVFGLLFGYAVAAEPQGPKKPSPQTRTFFIEGVKGQSDVTSITRAVQKVEHVTKVEELTASSGFANISFDNNAVTHQQVAQAIADAEKFNVSFRLAIPGYGANAEKIDAVVEEVVAIASPAGAIEKAHAELWRRFVDDHGIVCDYVGDLPTPEDCRLGKPNAIGWWSPIENGPMFTGIYLHSMVERARRSGSAMDKEQARRLSQGLLKCASVSDVPGFVARGVGSDGKCHYPLSSDDQMHPWFLGMHAYLRSDIPTSAERNVLIGKVREVAEALESYGWKVPCDGAFKGDFRGGFKGEHFRDAVRYLHMLHATYEMTGDAVWLERYRKALAERPEKSAETRQEISALGCPRDLSFIPHIEKGQLWIYVGTQAGLAHLAAGETDPAVKSGYRKGLEVNAKFALPAVETHAQFDNADQKVYGHARWREVYATWFPQKTQEDARRLSEVIDKKKAGTRKYYESTWMKNALAGAAIVAVAGDESGRPIVLKAVSHYDYAKLNMAEFFFAEVAYYALPEVK